MVFDLGWTWLAGRAGRLGPGPDKLAGLHWARVVTVYGLTRGLTVVG